MAFKNSFLEPLKTLALPHLDVSAVLDALVVVLKYSGIEVVQENRRPSFSSFRGRRSA